MGGNRLRPQPLSFDSKQLADSGAQVQIAEVAGNGSPATNPKVTAAIVERRARHCGDINVYAGLVDPLAAGGNAQLNGGSVLAVNDGAITVNQGGSSLTFTRGRRDHQRQHDRQRRHERAARQFRQGVLGWQTGDGIYLSAGAGNITLADGSSLRGDRIYYIIRRAAPDGQAIIQLADTQEDAARRRWRSAR